MLPSFDYVLARPIPGRLFGPIFLVTLIVYTVIVTLVAVIAVGYEYVPTISPDYNSTAESTPRMWYHTFKTSLTPRTRECQNSIIKMGES